MPTELARLGLSLKKAGQAEIADFAEDIRRALRIVGRGMRGLGR